MTILNILNGLLKRNNEVRNFYGIKYRELLI